MSLAVVAHTCNPDTQEEDLCESEISQDYNSSSRSTIFDPQLQPKERLAKLERDSATVKDTMERENKFLWVH